MLNALPHCRTSRMGPQRGSLLPNHQDVFTHLYVSPSVRKQQCPSSPTLVVGGRRSNISHTPLRSALCTLDTHNFHCLSQQHNIDNNGLQTNIENDMNKIIKDNRNNNKKNEVSASGSPWKQSHMLLSFPTCLNSPQTTHPTLLNPFNQ